jgi:NitT/TauT family transport system substrate-binding protein
MRIKQLILLTMLPALVAGGATAQALDEVSLRLNWYLVGFHAPIYLGKERGFYEQEGIDLTINEGRGSGVATQAIGAKSDTFGLADGGTMVLAAAKGIPIKTVMTPMNVSPFGIVARDDAGIKTPKDLEGKKLAVTAGDALTQIFPAVIEVNNLNKDAIEMVFVDPAGKVVSVLEGKADALLGSADAQFFQIEAKGVKASYLNFADIGVNTVGLTVIAHEDTINDNPDLIKRFVKATVRSFEAGQADPDAAVQAALKAKPDLDFDTIKGQLMIDLELLHTDLTKDKMIGYAAEEDWARTIELMTKYRELQTDRAPASFFTNEFLPQQ